jgi:hypothetical protein
MKNIYILPTDKPSRLHHYTQFINTKYWSLSKEPLQWKTAHYIYITDDSKIEVGDWFYDGDSELCKYTSDYVVNPNGWNDNKKIILTTDGDLIKDGVQAIDDEFLEWFVKNPSCEWFEVKKEMYMPFDGKVPFELSLDQSLNTCTHYKIITKDYLQGFIDLHNNELEHWDAVEFLEWLKLNDFKIVKK